MAATVTSAVSYNKESNMSVSSGDVDEREAVDLGLSVMWATCNVGATAPEEFGDYYAWGETVTKEDYDYNTYKFNRNKSVGLMKLTKYNTDDMYGVVDYKAVLEPKDDVARVKLGETWRMPTESEFIELVKQCSWKKAALNGVDGFYVISKVNGNRIFLPFAGYRYQTRLKDAGLKGHYWSSSLEAANPNSACHLFFKKSVGRSYSFRYFGQSIRPVKDYD